ncbi:MAG: chorismate mutase [Candidatus Fermentibacteraceae bacterium]|nr:chorismate mutase [Candidatus Fermentibacteraceae bacterium]
MNDTNEIKKLREQIDAVDTEIVKLLNRRIEIVLRISEQKAVNNIPVEDISREEEVISKLDHGDLSDRFLRDIYKVIFKYSKTVQ